MFPCYQTEGPSIPSGGSRGPTRGRERTVCQLGDTKNVYPTSNGLPPQPGTLVSSGFMPQKRTGRPLNSDLFPVGSDKNALAVHRSGQTFWRLSL